MLDDQDWFPRLRAFFSWRVVQLKSSKFDCVESGIVVASIDELPPQHFDVAASTFQIPAPPENSGDLAKNDCLFASYRMAAIPRHVEEFIHGLDEKVPPDFAAFETERRV